MFVWRAARKGHGPTDDDARRQVVHRPIGVVLQPQQEGRQQVLEAVAAVVDPRLGEGDAGGDPLLVPALLSAGLRSLSVQPGLAGAVKATIASLDLSTDV